MCGKFFRLTFACTLMSTLCSCRAFDASRCSATDVVDTVKSLSGGNDNPIAAVFLQMAHATFSLDAIRTVSSSSNETICEGRLTVRSKMSVPTRLPQEGPAPPETAADKAFREQMQQQLTTKVTEITYKLEKTDDGRTYVTIIPSETEILNRQNAQQQDQERWNEQDRELRAEQERSIQRQEQYERDLQSRWRQ